MEAFEGEAADSLLLGLLEDFTDVCEGRDDVLWVMTLASPPNLSVFFYCTSRKVVIRILEFGFANDIYLSVGE